MSAGKADTWVTLERVDVDRCASAWLIKRFIDEDPKFVFFEQGKEGEALEGIGYDYFGAKYFHKGSDCTFTALIKAYGLSENKALQRMNSDVNDVFSWRWRPGSFPVRFREHIALLRETCENDEAVYENLYATFDLLYWSYGGNFSLFSFSGERLTQTFSLRIMLPHLLANDTGTSRQLSEDTILGEPDYWLQNYQENLIFKEKPLPELPGQSWLYLLSKKSDEAKLSSLDAVQSIFDLRMEILQKRVSLEDDFRGQKRDRK